MVDQPPAGLRAYGDEDVAPELEGAAEGFFVGGYDADAVLEEERVGFGDVLAGGVVHDDASVCFVVVFEDAVDLGGREAAGAGGGGELF